VVLTSSLVCFGAFAQAPVRPGPMESVTHVPSAPADGADASRPSYGKHGVPYRRP
jgi:hypothetical protein